MPRFPETNIARWGRILQTGADLTPHILAISSLLPEATFLNVVGEDGQTMPPNFLVIGAVLSGTSLTRELRANNAGSLNVNIASWSNTALSAGNITQSIQNLDVMLSSRASEATLQAVANNTALLQPIALDSVFDTAVAATTDILANPISPTSNPSILRITAAVDSPTQLIATLTRGGNTVSLRYNAGSPLQAEALYVFDFAWRQGDEVNFQTTDPVTVLLLNADEVPAAAA